LGGGVMSRGYIVIAQNNNEYDYLEMTYALALSLKATQTENSICVCVDPHTKSLITEKHKKVFDHIVDIPFGDPAEFMNWKIQNKWKYIHMTPYDETIILDSDMLFTHDVSFWWDYLEDKDFWACTNVKTFRNEDVVSDYYRKKFVELELPNVYSNFTYFKKNERSFEIFRMIEMIMVGWDEFYDKFLKGIGQTWCSADLAYALAIKLLDAEEETCDYDIKDVPTFVHMKSFVQNIDNTKIDAVWTKSIPATVNDDLSVTVGNYKQTMPFHYVEKEWLTPEIITKYEKVLDI
jgi:hypothetical protein